VWQLRGKYPNRTYPKIFNDETIGKEAKRVFDEAQSMLKDIVDQGLLEAHGIIGFFPANSSGDDIIVYPDEDRKVELTRFCTLRQQAQKEGNDSCYTALSDFIAPCNVVPDYIGAFAVGIFGVDKLVQIFTSQLDDYKCIMVKALADRLAEAFAEKSHLDMRKVHWGYAPTENFDIEELLKVKYEGIRPAPGYPSQPDHTEKLPMWKLMDVAKHTGIELTESLAMMPASSVSALCFANKNASYFAVDKICKDQVEDYAKRKKMEVKDVERWLESCLNYDRQ